VDEILIKYLVGSATAEERDIALSWINEGAENQKYFDELKDYYELTKVTQKPSGFISNDGWNRVKAGYYRMQYQQEIQRNKVKRIIIRYAIPIAACVFVSFLLGFFTSNFLSVNNSQKSTIAYNEIRVPLGAKSQVILSDGTKVWLNAGSKFRYPVNFMQGNREVYLDGEAFFDVTKMDHKLFIVKTSKLNIKVYGTQFNVKSYPEENLIQTTLVKGSVAIESADKAERGVIYLKPNESATYYKNEKAKVAAVTATSTPKSSNETTEVKNVAEAKEKIIVIPKVDPLPITSWKDTRWVIAGEDLGQLTIKLERRYNVKIAFETEDLKRYKFSGTLAEETFEQVLKVIQLSAPIKFSIEGNYVIFSADPLYKKNYDKMISRINNQ
jgi:transmembrane sensor